MHLSKRNWYISPVVKFTVSLVFMVDYRWENHPRHGYSPVKDSSFIYFLKTFAYPDNYRYSYNLDTCKPSLLITHWINGQTWKTGINNYYFYFDCNKYDWIINYIRILRQQIRLDYKLNQKLKFLQSDKTCLIEEIQLKQKKKWLTAKIQRKEIKCRKY